MSWTVDDTCLCMFSHHLPGHVYLALWLKSQRKNTWKQFKSGSDGDALAYFRCTRFQTTLDRSRLTTEGKTNKSVTMENSLDRMSGARALGWWWLTKAGETEEVELWRSRLWWVGAWLGAWLGACLGAWVWDWVGDEWQMVSLVVSNCKNFPKKGSILIWSNQELEIPHCLCVPSIPSMCHLGLSSGEISDNYFLIAVIFVAHCRHYITLYCCQYITVLPLGSINALARIRLASVRAWRVFRIRGHN